MLSAPAGHLLRSGGKEGENFIAVESAVSGGGAHGCDASGLFPAFDGVSGDSEQPRCLPDWDALLAFQSILDLHAAESSMRRLFGSSGNLQACGFCYRLHGYSMVVWITPGFGVFGLSSNAERASDLPDGSFLDEAFPGDDYSVQAMDCVMALALGKK